MLATLAFASLVLVTASQPAAQEPGSDAAPPRTRRGLVVDENGAPVAGAAVGFFPTGGLDDTAALLANPQARTDDAGAYELELTGGFGGQIAVALESRQTCAFPPSGESLPTAVLLPGGTLFGRLRNPDGTPVVGAQVTVGSPVLRGPATPLRLHSVARSDAQGIFSVPGVATTGMKVTVTSDGHYEREVFATQQTPLDLTLEPYRGFVRGVVLLPDGEPLADARVIIAGGAGVSAVSPVTTDGEGRFAIGVPRTRAFRVQAIRRPHWATSELLTDATDDLELRAAAPANAVSDTRSVRVRVTDARGEPIARFRASAQAGRSLGNDQTAMLQHLLDRAPLDGPEADVAVKALRPDSDQILVIVDAEGHGWQSCAVATDHEGVIEVALGPEAKIRGVVVDAVSGEPIAGAAVRALPVGRASGGGQNPADSGIFTDERGRFVIPGQKPGDYHVQAHAESREVSQPVEVEATVEGNVEGEAECRLQLDPPHRLRFRVGAADPLPGPPPFLDLSPDQRARPSVEGFFAYFQGNTVLQRIPIEPDRAYDLGPVTAGHYRARLTFPSRVQLGHGLTFDLDPIPTDREDTVIELPRRVGHLVRGRVHLPPGVPPGRLLVVARSLDVSDARPGIGSPDLSSAPMAGDGSFALDLPAGRYRLQLVDLASGIVFHTDEDAIDVDAEIGRVQLRPEFRWLTIRLEGPDDPEATPIVQSLAVTLPTQAGQPSLLQTGFRTPDQNSGTIELAVRRYELRWLVPAGPISLRPQQAFGHLGEGLATPANAVTTIDINRPEQDITLSVAAPPSIEELRQRER